MLKLTIGKSRKCDLFRQPVCFLLGPTRRGLQQTAAERAAITASVVNKDVGVAPNGRPNLNTSDISVYKSKKTSEIIRALLVLKLCSYNVIVKNGVQLMNIGRKTLGQRLFNHVMRLTFYGQFVGGQTDEQIDLVVDKLRLAGLGPLLCVPIEEAPDSALDTDQIYNDNLQKVIDCIDKAAEVDQSTPMSQLKLTALIPGDLCKVLSQLVPDPLADNCNAIHAIVRCLEGESLHIDGLSDRDTEELTRGLDRVRLVGERVVSKGVRLLIDAEYTYMNPALRMVSLAAMLAYNKERPLVAYTYQNYLKETHLQLRNDITMIRNHGACFAVKLVRGAYIVQERQSAELEKYPDPVHDTFEDTSQMYSRSVKLLLDNIQGDPDKFYAIIATHNQDSVMHGINEMAIRGIDNNCESVFFGQLYGMDDSLSCALGQSGYLVYKSVPLGSVEETIPYLYRRAVENSTFLSPGHDRDHEDRRVLWRTLVDRATFGLVTRNKSLS